MGWTKVGNTNDQETKVRYGKTYKKVGNIKDVQPSQTAQKGWVKVGNVKGAAPKLDVQQSPNYLKAQTEAKKYADEAAKASSFRGMATNALKASPQAAADVMLGTPAKFIASAIEAPEVAYKGKYTDRTYKVPGLTPFKSFQSDYGKVADQVISGEKGMGSAAWELAKIPLAGLETGVGAGGLLKGAKALKAGNVKQAGAIVSDAFLPTNFSNRAANRLTPLPPKSPLPEIQGTSQLKPLPSRTAPLESVPRTKFQKSVPYTEGIKPLPEKVNARGEFYGRHNQPLSVGENVEIDTMFGKEKAQIIGTPYKDRFGKDVVKIKGLQDSPHPVYGSKKGAIQEYSLDQIGGKDDIKYFNNYWDNYKSGNDKIGQSTQSPLLQEARKYKSAEEFVKAQGEDIPKVIEKIKNISKPTGKERGFIESVRKSPEISQDLASLVEGTYDVKHNKPLQEQSQRLIFDNITEAERIAKNDVGAEGGIMNTELIKHYDSIAQKAKQAGDVEAFEAAMNRADEITSARAANLTETAQNLQAASTISKLSPEGLLHYITKVSKDIGSPVKLSNDVKFDFMRRAGEIQNILDPREKAFKTFDLIDDLAEAMPKGQSDKLLNALNLPRAIMSTGDLSAPLRQGIFTAARNPITFGKNFGKMFKYAFSEDAYRNLKADIITSPNYDLYVKHKLPLTDISAGLTGREEAFMSNLAEKIPVFGKLAKGSNRAYTGFLNKMRVDLFDDFVNTAKLNGIKDQKYFDDAARFVGAATGRGNLVKTLEGSAPALNSIFFSPRLMASRISLINPAFYMKLEPTVRKEALKSLGAFVGTGMSILALAKANGAEVSSDPRSADFGKMKFGNTRYDIWGGFQQYARLIGQLATGEKVSTITGKETTLGQGYNAPTRESIFLDFLKSKEAPIMSLLTRAAQGEKYGEQFNLPVELVDRFLPMVTSDAFDLYKEYGPKGVAGAVPGFFGVGSQTYGDQIPTMGTTEANNPTIKWRTQPGLGETILNSVTGKEVSTLPKDQWKALYEERKQEQIRQAEVDKVKAVVLISGEPQYVGDTKVYLENGVVKTKKEGKEKRLPLKDQLLYEEIQKRKSGQPFYK